MEEKRNIIEEKEVGSRLLFSSNLTKQPVFIKTNFRISGSLVNTDRVMNNSFLDWSLARFDRPPS